MMLPRCLKKSAWRWKDIIRRRRIYIVIISVPPTHELKWRVSI